MNTEKLYYIMEMTGEGIWEQFSEAMTWGDIHVLSGCLKIAYPDLEFCIMKMVED